MWTYIQKILRTFKTSNPSGKKRGAGADVHPSQLANEHIKNYSTVLVIREMQSKITSRHYFTPSEMTTIKRTDHTKCWQGGGAMGHCYWECKVLQPL